MTVADFMDRQHAQQAQGRCVDKRDGNSTQQCRKKIGPKRMIANSHDVAKHPQQQRVRRIPGRVRDAERPGSRNEISTVGSGIQPGDPA